MPQIVDDNWPGFLIGLGLSGVISGLGFGYLLYNGKIFQIKKAPRPYKDYKELMKDLKSSDTQVISNVLIEGEVTPLDDDRIESKLKDELYHSIYEHGPAGIVKDADKSISRKFRNPNPTISGQYIPDPPPKLDIPFALKSESSEIPVTIKKISDSDQFNSVLEHCDIKCEIDFKSSDLTYRLVRYENLKYDMLVFGGNVAVIGNAHLKVKGGKAEIIIYDPMKVGKSLQSLIPKTRLKWMFASVLVLGGIVLIGIAVFAIYRTKKEEKMNDKKKE
uniref:Uncharacterized protein n=1 Tax=Amphimedon queenslandica TaxID=400682 RepID=A0A1X7TAW8_AMPQE